MRILFTLVLFSIFSIFTLNQPYLATQPSLVSVNKQATSAPNQKSSVSAFPSTSKYMPIKDQRSTSNNPSSSAKGQSSVIDIVPSNPLTYSDALNSANPSRKPSPIYN